MRYYCNPTSPRVRDLMRSDPRFGCATTRAQGNRIPIGADYLPVPYFCDNGKYGKGWIGEVPWFRWLMRKVSRYGPEWCAGAVAPDVPFDAAGTLAESGPWLERIRALKVPVMFCAQNGSEAPGMIPWGRFDVLFLAGDTAWKLSPMAADLAAEAVARGLPVHMGRVTTEGRLRHAAAIGCSSVDSTTTAVAPGSVEEIVRFLDRLDTDPPRVEYPLLLDGSPDYRPARPARRLTARPPALEVPGPAPVGMDSLFDLLPATTTRRG